MYHKASSRKEYNIMLFAKQTFFHLTIAAFFALFGAIYELFSHEVYSYFMLYAFAIPLILGALPCSILTVFGHKKPFLGLLTKRTFFFWNCGVLTLTIGCAFQGVLEIYGTSSRLIVVYPIAGILLLAAACCMYVISHWHSRTAKKSLL